MECPPRASISPWDQQKKAEGRKAPFYIFQAWMCGVKLQSSGDTEAAEHLERLSAITGFFFCEMGAGPEVFTLHGNIPISTFLLGSQAKSCNHWKPKWVSTVLESQTPVQSWNIIVYIISRRRPSTSLLLDTVSFYVKVCGMLLTSTAKLMYFFLLSLEIWINRTSHPSFHMRDLFRGRERKTVIPI